MGNTDDDPKATPDELDAAWQAGYDTKGKYEPDANPHAGVDTAAGRAQSIAFCQGRVAARADAGKLDTGRTWSVQYLPDNGGAPKPATTLEQLLEALDVAGDDAATQRLAVAQLLADDAWDDAPAKLKDQVNEWLIAGRPKQQVAAAS